MTSFNHYALGAVADWLHRTVAGLAPAAPGYRDDPRPSPAVRRSHLRVGPAPHSLRRGQRRLGARRRAVPTGRTRSGRGHRARVLARCRHAGEGRARRPPLEYGRSGPTSLCPRQVHHHPRCARRPDHMVRGRGRRQGRRRRTSRRGTSRRTTGAHLDAPAATLVRALASDEFSPHSTAFRHQVDAILSRPEPEAQNAVPQR